MKIKLFKKTIKVIESEIPSPWQLNLFYRSLALLKITYHATKEMITYCLVIWVGSTCWVFFPTVGDVYFFHISYLVLLLKHKGLDLLWVRHLGLPLLLGISLSGLLIFIAEVSS